MFAKKIIDLISTYLYSYILIILLVGCGVWFTLRTRFVQLRLLPDQFRCVTEKNGDGKGISSFQALMVSTASRVGTGNIIGVSTAICMGGFGSVFWMWVIAIVGSASAFIESTLAQIFKKSGKDGWYGGPAYYIEAFFKKRGLAVVFSVLLILTYGVGFNMLASYNIQSTFSSYGFYNPAVTPWLIGGILAVTVGFCLFGGGKRMVRVTEFLVPIMGVAYIGVALVVVALNYRVIPDVLSRIFSGAFDFKAIFGGFGGSALMYGVKRGLFSNEAGVGSAPNASATAEVSHPVKQGLVQILSVFIDTLLVCTATAFMCMCSGIEPSPSLSGAPFVQLSLTATLGKFGPVFITVAMLLFGFTTLIGNLYYVDGGLFYILKNKPEKEVLSVYYVIASALIFVGSGLDADFLWNIADITMGLMALINIPVILILGKVALRALDDYDRKRKNGEEMSFDGSSVPYNTDAWK
ncbi:MAG: alanine:cation symporter family protein [Ruminococcaceae bacterium]|nr:alanine:cation symporter family protein [Oscillospiraceae bacterium]